MSNQSLHLAVNSVTKRSLYATAIIAAPVKVQVLAWDVKIEQLSAPTSKSKESCLRERYNRGDFSYSHSDFERYYSVLRECSNSARK